MDSTIGKNSISFSDNAYQLYILLCPYPDATTKTFIPVTIDIGIIKFITTVSLFKINIIVGTSYTVSVEINSNNNTVKISDFVWSGTDISTTAKLIVSEITD